MQAIFCQTVPTFEACKVFSLHSIKGARTLSSTEFSFMSDFTIVIGLNSLFV